MSTLDKTESLITVLTLSIGDQRLAIPAGNLREILDPLPRTRVPGAGATAPWVMNVRGAVVPLADLGIPLGLPPRADTTEADDRRRFVVLEVLIGDELAKIGIIADVVHDVTTLSAARIEPLPPASQFPAEFLRGLYRGPDGFVLIPDLSAIFTHLAHRSAAAA